MVDRERQSQYAVKGTWAIVEVLIEGNVKQEQIDWWARIIDRKSQERTWS